MARNVKVELIYGPPGTGKSHHIETSVDPTDIYWFSPQPSSAFFDGYAGERYVVFDDFIGAHMPRNMLYRVLDHYPLRVPIKGTTAVAKYEHVFVTSNYWPDQWYQDQDNLWAVCRRFHRVGLKLTREDEIDWHDVASKSDWRDVGRLVGRPLFLQDLM